jgi:hypothetical protein
MGTVSSEVPHLTCCVPYCNFGLSWVSLVPPGKLQNSSFILCRDCILTQIFSSLFLIQSFVAIQGVSKVLGQTSGVSFPYKDKENSSYQYTSSDT